MTIKTILGPCAAALSTGPCPDNGAVLVEGLDGVRRWLCLGCAADAVAGGGMPVPLDADTPPPLLMPAPEPDPAERHRYDGLATWCCQELIAGLSDWIVPDDDSVIAAYGTAMGMVARLILDRYPVSPTPHSGERWWLVGLERHGGLLQPEDPDNMSCPECGTPGQRVSEIRSWNQPTTTRRR